MPHLLARFNLHYHAFFKRLQPHTGWCLALLAVTVMFLSINGFVGQKIAMQDWSWLDIVGEGSLVVFVVVWMMIVLATRSPGSTTNWLACGFLGVYVASLQDVMDEVVDIPKSAIWDHWVESLPIGLLMLVVGLVLWYREQRQLSSYLHKRAPLLQNHRKLHGDTLLPQWPSLVKAIRESGVGNQCLVIISAVPDTDNQPPLHPLDISKLRMLIAESLVWNVSEAVKPFHLTGDSYALLANEPMDIKQLNDVISLLRAMRFHGVHRTKPSALSVNIKTLNIHRNLPEAALKEEVRRAQQALVALNKEDTSQWALVEYNA